jgi:2-dehydro-3-deoxygluconokinase
MSTMSPHDVDWLNLLKTTRAFHVSGITPALSKSATETTEVALRAARGAGCLVTFDLNYRARLWSAEEAHECFARLLPRVNVLFTTSDDLELVFGLSGDCCEMAEQVRQMFALDVVVITIREASTVLRGTWRSIAFADRLYTGKIIDLELIDRVGSGDAYSAGFIYGYLTGDIAKAIAYGDAMSTLKHSMPGDFAYVTQQEVERHIASAPTKIVR